MFVFTRNIARGIEGSTWYHMEKHGWSKSGLLNSDNERLPAYYAFQVMTSTLGGTAYNQTLSLGSGILGYDFRIGGKRIWVLFSENGSLKNINTPDWYSRAYNLLGKPVFPSSGKINFTRPIYVLEDFINNPPEYTSTPIIAGSQGLLYTYNITTSDPDLGEKLVLTAQTKPPWLTLVDNGDGTGILSGTPTNAHVGNHSIELRVMDRDGLTDTQTFTITVANVNDPPRFTSKPVTVAPPLEIYSYTVTATDPDYIHGSEDLLITSDNDLPDWLTLSGTSYDGDGIWSAILSGIRPEVELDDVEIVLKVIDNDEAYVTQTFLITPEQVGISFYLPLIVR